MIERINLSGSAARLLSQISKKLKGNKLFIYRHNEKEWFYYTVSSNENIFENCKLIMVIDVPLRINEMKSILENIKYYQSTVTIEETI